MQLDDIVVEARPILIPCSTGPIRRTERANDYFYDVIPGEYFVAHYEHETPLAEQ